MRKLKIKGMLQGRKHSLTIPADVPSFNLRKVKLDDTTFDLSVESQEKEWLSDNYDKLVSPYYEKGEFDLIFDASLVAPQPREKKKEKIKTLLFKVFPDDADTIKEVLIIITNMWETIKGNSPEKIVEIALHTRNIATDHSVNVLKYVTESAGLNDTYKLN